VLAIVAEVILILIFGHEQMSSISHEIANAEKCEPITIDSSPLELVHEHAVEASQVLFPIGLEQSARMSSETLRSFCQTPLELRLEHFNLGL